MQCNIHLCKLNYRKYYFIIIKQFIKLFNKNNKKIFSVIVLSKFELSLQCGQ